jgi:hypothetical protein
MIRGKLLFLACSIVKFNISCVAYNSMVEIYTRRCFYFICKSLKILLQAFPDVFKIYNKIELVNRKMFTLKSIDLCINIYIYIYKRT